MKKDRVSTAVIRRLPRYYRHLDDLYRSGSVRISSSALAKSMGLTASQIRQDLSCFGEFGQQGYGYNVERLRSEVAEILGMNRNHTAVILGAGNLGRALIENFPFRFNGFRLIAAFDVEPTIVGTRLGGSARLSHRHAGKLCQGARRQRGRAHGSRLRGGGKRAEAGILRHPGHLEFYQCGTACCRCGIRQSGRCTFCRQPSDIKLYDF